MQPLSPIATAPAAREAGRGAAAGRSDAAKAATLPAAAHADSRPVRGLRAARRDWDPTLNRQTAGAQQALAYLEQLSSQLQMLKASLSARLAGGLPGDAALDSQVQAVDQAWRQRASQAGGSLDAQLRFSSDGKARQGFRIRGLDAAALRGGERETLSFSIAGSDKPPMSTTLDAGATLAANVKRLDRALAPAGIQVTLDADGEPLFSVDETLWAGLKDDLALKGGGLRFPAGQPHRVRTEAQPEALQPSNWGGDDAAALRRSLQEVTQALERIRRIAEAVRQALEQASAPAAVAAETGDPAWAESFAKDFGARVEASDYEVYAAVAPALASVNRSRVLSLLSLK